MRRNSVAAAVFVAGATSLLSSAQPPPQLSIVDEVRAGHALFAAFQKAQGFAETTESSRTEAYLQEVGQRVAHDAKRQLPYTFHLDPHPGFRSAVAYPGGALRGPSIPRAG